LQAEVLAKYRPTINATTLIAELKHVDDRATRAIGYFKSTRHTVVYYEDVVGNRTVRHLCCCVLIDLPLKLNSLLTNTCLVFNISNNIAGISCAETERGSRLLEVAI